MGPVACPSHVDAVPRRAVRKVGPRPDLTRSTHIGEPCGPARLLGDGSRSSCSPYRATNQSTGGGGMKNGGSNPPAPGNRCVGAPGRPIVPSRGLLVLLSSHAPRAPARRRRARRLGLRHLRAQQPPVRPGHRSRRSEEHTSELQSRGHLVCRLLLENKKTILVQNATTAPRVRAIPTPNQLSVAALITNDRAI